MTNRTDVARGREIIARWCTLAEQRLEYLTELFETGRWRRFHTEAVFLENVQEAKKAVETWHTLLNQEAASDNSRVDTSWLDRKAVPPRRPSILRNELPPMLPRSLRLMLEQKEAERPVKVEVQVEVQVEQEPVYELEMESAADDSSWQPRPDLAVMQERYPLLRNAL
jgi:uncharacterized repeat protein (TIGR03809 family)